ncbi:MAG: isocitrate lyase/PEP mutase family protein [Cyanobium sp. CZS 25K]|nr:isocitrate lyase/PEP mutase family protein [Cyanobium sp. CZS25K]
MNLGAAPGTRLRAALREAGEGQRVLPFVGIYDLFSASLAAEHFDAMFLSGFGLAASMYGLPDIGFVGWGDLTTSTSRLRALLPDHHLLVDIDDGFGDPAVASHVARTLERCGASGVVLEDQARPRRCGHLDGKRLLPLQDYLNKLGAVLRECTSLLVVARTDASDPDEILERIQAFEQAGCDAVLADGIKDLALFPRLRAAISCPLFCNVIGGGKVPACSRRDLADHGVQGLIYSTPCLFAAHGAIEQALEGLKHEEAELSVALAAPRELSHCNAVLEANLRRAGGS